MPGDGGEYKERIKMGFLSGITSFVKEHSAVIHGVLDVAGFIPGIGAVADLANAGLYAAEGNYLDAGLSLMSAIPGIGDTVALAKKTASVLKGGLKGLKSMNALKKAKGIKAVLTSMRGKAQTGALNLKKGIMNADEAVDAIKKEVKELCTNGRCFTGDTLVYTRQGYRPIKEIQKGDEVYSRNEKTGETALKEVEEVFRTTAHTIYHIWTDGKEAFKTTAYHPVYVQEQGWVTAINLREGDTIKTMDGVVHITKVKKTRHEEAVPVYNFHVKDWVSYFVGNIKCYIHNLNGIRHIEDKNKVSNATDLLVIEKGTKEWHEAAKNIANGGNTSYRTRTATDAKELLNEARGNMNRYKRYTSKQYKKGYEIHPSEINTRNAPHNDLPHIKWKDWLGGKHSGKGHIFFNKPN